MTGSVLIFSLKRQDPAHDAVKMLVASCADIAHLSIVGPAGRFPTTVIVEIASLPYDDAVQIAETQAGAQRPVVVAADDFDITEIREAIGSGKLSGVLRTQNQADLWAYLAGN